MFRFCFLFVSIFSSLSAQLPVQVTAESAIVINATNGKVLYEKNADTAQFPASLTKIATVIYTLTKRPECLYHKVVASHEAIKCFSEEKRRANNYTSCPNYVLETGYSHVGLKRGEEKRIIDLLYAQMLPSGDDASNVLAEYLGGGSIDRFVGHLNAFLHAIGCKHTRLYNPHGLHHPDHVTTARDMAILCRYAMQHPLFRTMAKTVRYEKPQTNKQPKSYYLQTNKLLKKGEHHYPLAVGIKTGYTSHAQSTLAAAAEKNGTLLIAILLRSPDRISRFREAKALFEAAFSSKKIEKQFLTGGAQSFSRTVIGGTRPLRTYLKEAVSYAYAPIDPPVFRCQLVWDEKKAPIAANDKVGQIQLLADGALVKTVPLFATESVEMNLLTYLWQSAQELWIYALLGLLALMMLSSIFTPKKQSSK